MMVRDDDCALGSGGSHGTASFAGNPPASPALGDDVVWPLISVTLLVVARRSWAAAAGQRIRY